ncbi:MAG: hydroxyacylglutathione hydrolase [Proteobacteria bacterium]|nr:hydroxyacylglutathione hydrolase [Pseudomonadota bacterium]
MSFEVVQIPVWQDNYAYLLCADDGTAALVDSPEAPPIQAELDRRGLRLTHIFQTHHHFDHVGANAALVESVPELKVWGGAYDSEHERIPGQTRVLRDGERATWAGETAVIHEVPGHTLGHIAWRWSNGAAFVGDTLFVAGCGRFFEGTPAQMDVSLNEVIAGWPPDTKLYCAHEYTQSNLRFALHVDPDNADLQALSQEVDALRAEGQPTVPSTLARELSCNPFLRCDTPAIRAATASPKGAPRHDVLGRLRAMKDGFRG